MGSTACVLNRNRNCLPFVSTWVSRLFGGVCVACLFPVSKPRHINSRFIVNTPVLHSYLQFSAYQTITPRIEGKSSHLSKRFF